MNVKGTKKSPRDILILVLIKACEISPLQLSAVRAVAYLWVNVTHRSIFLNIFSLEIPCLSDSGK